MRKVYYMCDICGADLPDNRYDMTAHLVEKNDPMMQVKFDFCETCYKSVLESIEGMKIYKPETPAKKMPGRSKVDTGKIKALRAAGWGIAKIAKEMKCSNQTVYNALSYSEGLTSEEPEEAEDEETD